MARVLVKPSCPQARCPSSPRRQGPSAFGAQTEAYGKATCNLSIGQRPQWNASHRRHQQLGRSDLATPQSCSTWLYSPTWDHAFGVVRDAWDHGSSNYPGKAVQEMEQGMENTANGGIQSLLERSLARNHRSELRHWAPAYAGMTDIARVGMNGTGFAADGEAEHPIDH